MAVVYFVPMSTPDDPYLSLLIPVYNEEANLRALWEELEATLHALGVSWEVVFVDDGSQDKSGEVLRALHYAEPRIRVVRFVRNYGQQMAVTAGLRYCRGCAVVMMDADLQTPAKHIPEFLETLREGFDIVYGMRATRHGPLYRRLGTRLANRFICFMTGFNIPDSASGFLALDERLVRNVNMYNERSRYLSGMFAWLSYGRYTVIPVSRRDRLHGESKYTFYQLIRLVINFATSFSTRPLRWPFAIAALPLALAAPVGWRACRLFMEAGLQDSFIPALTCMFLLASALQLAAVGVIGHYAASVYGDVRERPSYVISEILGEPSS